MPPSFLLLGRVLRPHGIRGELRIEVMTDYPERITPDTELHLGSDPDDAGSVTTYRVANARKHQQYLILHLEGISDRSAADRLRGLYVMVAFDDAVPLEEGEFYLFQAIGWDVYTEDGEFLGQVAEIIETGANDVYVVNGPRGEILLPAIDECVVDIDIDAGRMTVRLMDGLLGD
ncbi:MAG: 16S rRNA processing protein RimM [Anaerolineae bacterium]|nr:16S rRNA processing protein RimM [Anaerolineae bacterium]